MMYSFDKQEGVMSNGETKSEKGNNIKYKLNEKKIRNEKIKRISYRNYMESMKYWIKCGQLKLF